MWFRRFYQVIGTLVAAAFLCVIGLGLCAQKTSKLGALDGERVFYLDSASSQGLRTEELSPLDIFRVKGESVRFARSGESESALVARIRDTYGAEIVFCEEIDGVTSYYCYTGAWDNGIALGGVTVNLHIAVSETACAVGTPIIFDGF